MDKKKKITALIQARMGSTRLPGKVLRDILGKPMLWHIVNRLGQSTLIDKTLVITTTDKKDDMIEDFCRKYNIELYRGNENDVLDRYYQAAKLIQADYIVRVTADCPLVDPEVLDKVVRGCVNNVGSFDGASNVIKRTYPVGLDTEVIKFSILENTWKRANKEYQREHVTIFIYEHPELFKISSIENEENLSHMRWTVDEEADLIFVGEIYQRLYRQGKIFLMNDILKLLKREPHLDEINKNIKQKAIIK